MIEREKLEKLYYQDKLSACKVADLLGVSPGTVHRWLVRYQIPYRGSVQAHRLRTIRGPLKGFTKGDLEGLYNQRKLSTPQIAKYLGITATGVCFWMARWGIARRSISEAKRLLPCKPTMNGGYVRIKMWGHSRATKSGYVSEHILVWEKEYGQPLPQGFLIHHLNGTKHDNRPENLAALPKGKHHIYLINQALQARIRFLETNYVEGMKLNVDD